MQNLLVAVVQLLVGAFGLLAIGAVVLGQYQSRQIDAAIASRDAAMLAMAQRASLACGATPTPELLNAGVPPEKLGEWAECFYGRRMLRLIPTEKTP